MPFKHIVTFKIGFEFLSTTYKIIVMRRCKLQAACEPLVRVKICNLIYASVEFRETAHENVKRAKGRLTSLDGVSVLNGVGRGPSTTRAAFYRSPLLLPLSLLPLPLSRLYFLQLPVQSTVTGLDVDASDREQMQTQFSKSQLSNYKNIDSLTLINPNPKIRY